MASCKTARQPGQDSNPYELKSRRVLVESVEVEFAFFQGRPDAYAVIKGQHSIEGARLTDTKQSRRGNTLIIELRESLPFGASPAIQQKRKEKPPFETRVPIEILGLPPGKYPIVANGVNGMLEIPEKFEDPSKKTDTFASSSSTTSAAASSSASSPVPAQNPVRWVPAPVHTDPGNSSIPMMEPMQINKPPPSLGHAALSQQAAGQRGTAAPQPQGQGLPPGMSAGIVPPGQSAFSLYDQYRDRDEPTPEGMSASASSGSPIGIYQQGQNQNQRPAAAGTPMSLPRQASRHPAQASTTHSTLSGNANTPAASNQPIEWD